MINNRGLRRSVNVCFRLQVERMKRMQKSEDEGYCSGNAVAARNGLWVILRYRPYCAAAVKPDLYDLIAYIFFNLCALFCKDCGWLSAPICRWLYCSST